MRVSSVLNQLDVGADRERRLGLDHENRGAAIKPYEPLPSCQRQRLSVEVMC